MCQIKPESKIIIKYMKDELQNCLDYCLEQNGRPDCKNCGLDAEMIKQHDEKIVKAFGGCTLCYGKGYATIIQNQTVHADFAGDRAVITPINPIHYCQCERGKALKKIIKENY